MSNPMREMLSESPPNSAMFSYKKNLKLGIDSLKIGHNLINLDPLEGRKLVPKTKVCSDIFRIAGLEKSQHAGSISHRDDDYISDGGHAIWRRK